MANVFLSYADGAFTPARDALCDSARAAGFDRGLARGPGDLDPAFAAAHRAILSQPRGGGYWLWKPQIILQELERLAEGDLLVYSDAGRTDYYRFTRFPARLAARARHQGFLAGVVTPQHGPLSRWTKRDTFLLTGTDTVAMQVRPPVQATWSFWTRSEAALRFLTLWRDACCDARALTDIPNELGQPNLPGFRDHRHDQSVLSLLAWREGAPVLDYRATGAFRILGLRPQAKVAHLFLKRIADAEALEGRTLPLTALIRSFRDLRR